jgi:TetR/AcrR family transcriptional regulator, repressor for neighboring sulfatase
MERDEKTTAARRRRPRRSREEATEALVSAAATLFAERESGHVTVRDIAARADVNPTYVHRYFGGKQNLMDVAILRAQERITARIDEMPDVVEGAGAVVHATLQEKELVATLARGILDGVLDGSPIGDPALQRLIERFEAEVARRRIVPAHDTRIVVAALIAATAGYALFGRYVGLGLRLDDLSEEQTEAAFVALLQDVARLAFVS